MTSNRVGSEKKDSTAVLDVLSLRGQNDADFNFEEQCVTVHSF